MSLIDERGRLFGKLNLIDAAVGLLLLFLIPLTYGAYALFRTPSPQITAVEAITLTDQGWRVRILGKDLRPFLQPFAGVHTGKFLIESSTRAEIQLPKLEAGTYDLALYDQAQEVARLVGALTIVPSEAFVATAAPPLTITTPPTADPFTVQVRVRFVVKPEVFALVRVGDADTVTSTTAEGGAVLTALGQQQNLVSQEKMEYGGRDITVVRTREPLTAFEAMLRVPVEALPNRVLYYNRAIPLRVGSSFTFGPPGYVMHGTIIQIIR